MLQPTPLAERPRLNGPYAGYLFCKAAKKTATIKKKSRKAERQCKTKARKRK